MNGFNASFLSIEQATGMYLGNGTSKSIKDEKKSEIESFKSILDKTQQNKEELKDLKFSKHASARLESRNISLSDEQLGRLNQGVLRAKTKNINESLVMMDNIAFIVNVKNNTVVTAIDKNEDNVFTNIDGAVIV